MSSPAEKDAQMSTWAASAQRRRVSQLKCGDFLWGFPPGLVRMVAHGAGGFGLMLKVFCLWSQLLHICARCIEESLASPAYKLSSLEVSFFKYIDIDVKLMLQV